eukprot:Ihof_evm1s1408 gene=Ihof_evmTU1s1408
MRKMVIYRIHSSTDILDKSFRDLSALNPITALYDLGKRSISFPKLLPRKPSNNKPLTLNDPIKK